MTDTGSDSGSGLPARPGVSQPQRSQRRRRQRPNGALLTSAVVVLAAAACLLGATTVAAEQQEPPASLQQLQQQQPQSPPQQKQRQRAYFPRPLAALDGGDGVQGALADNVRRCGQGVCGGLYRERVLVYTDVRKRRSFPTFVS